MSCTAHKILKSISQMNLGDVTDFKKKGKKRIYKEGKKLNKNKKSREKNILFEVTGNATSVM